MLRPARSKTFVGPRWHTRQHKLGDELTEAAGLASFLVLDTEEGFAYIVEEELAADDAGRPDTARAQTSKEASASQLA